MTTTSSCRPVRPKRALICGVCGQDGSYLAKHLLDKGYEVLGTSRDAATANRHNLKTLGIDRQIEVVSMAPNDFRSVLQSILRILPDEIYNLAGQASVGLSFEQPAETIESITIGALNLLEAMRFAPRPIRLYNAGSSECFGDTGLTPANEHTPFRPRSPYAVAKASAHNLVANYREAYGMFACTGILFNHESPLRPERFVTQKIVRAAQRIFGGSDETLLLGNLDIHRDWGWAPDYVEVMWTMLQRGSAEDFVIATGRSVPLMYFAERAFRHFDLDWRKHVRVDNSLLRPSDIRYSSADPSCAREKLGWRAQHDVDSVVALMCGARSMGGR